MKWGRGNDVFRNSFEKEPCSKELGVNGDSLILKIRMWHFGDVGDIFGKYHRSYETEAYLSHSYSVSPSKFTNQIIHSYFCRENESGAKREVTERY